MTLVTANLAIIDTSVYIDTLRSRRFERELLDLKFVIRCSAVVLAELYRGARSKDAVGFVDSMARNLRIVAPGENEWLESGKIVGRLARLKRYDVHKTREVHFDVLIALTARKIGAHLITRDVEDFSAIRQLMHFNLICW